MPPLVKSLKGHQGNIAVFQQIVIFGSESEAMGVAFLDAGSAPPRSVSPNLPLFCR